ncbi:pre-mRNA-splicing factor CWC22 [Artemisia annua]|uniref:Pre-mRNA-splicing factor CWC22 n=1 Tax=Artemisia annua TaxID=35608 RepID=A0A2U1Q3H6_ARTAN|nr:pre-mRNA-splicing factor CWC22 [Artemisia annua]
MANLDGRILVAGESSWNHGYRCLRVSVVCALGHKQFLVFTVHYKTYAVPFSTPHKTLTEPGCRRKMIWIIMARKAMWVVSRDYESTLNAYGRGTLALLENPTNDSVKVAVGFITESGSILLDLSPKGLHGTVYFWKKLQSLIAG